MPNGKITVDDIRRITGELDAELGRAADHSRNASTMADHRHMLHEYRAVYARFMEQAMARHHDGAGGGDVCSLITAIVDRIIMHAASTYFPPQSDEQGFAIIAMGGYGRGELNPLSDIDLLFVTDAPFTDRFETLISGMLQFLWDLNLDLGHSTRSVDECLEMADDDVNFATSLLEGRFISGDEDIWFRLGDSYETWLASDAGWRVAESKIGERDQRIESYAGTVQIQIPNVKESPGALRDIHHMRWLLRLTGRGHDLAALMATGAFIEEDVENIRQDLNFMLRVRNGLHFTTGKKSDLLDHLVLPELAVNLGYQGEGNEPVEHLMRDYYMRAGRERRYADRLTDSVRTQMAREAGASGTHGGFDAGQQTASLDPDEVATCTDHPETIIRFMSRAAAKGRDISGETAIVIERQCSLLDESLPENPAVQEAFLELVNMQTGAARAIRLLHEYGILVQLIPEMKEISWHYQYDFYHTYTTDEHSIRVVENLARMSDPEESTPEFAEVMADVPARGALFLAGLLHDIGKNEGRGHAHRGEQMAARALKRLGADRRTIELVRFLIREHLLMSHTSQRRDIDDEETITDFVERVGSAGRLRMLTLLTFADLMALSDGALTEWKKALLWSLYDKAIAVIDTGYERHTPAGRGQNVETITAALEGTVPADALAEHLGMLPEQYARVTSPRSIRSHMRGIEIMRRDGVWASFRRSGNISLLKVICQDYPRALSDICGAITSAGINIIGARIFTRTDGVIIDTFLVVDAEGNALIPTEAKKEFKRNVGAVIGGSTDVEKLIRDYRRRWRRVRKKVVYSPPRIRIHNDISSHYTVMDVFATDYTGLLYDITSLMAAMNIDIHAARIGTDEDQITDAFYIRRRGGGKIEDRDELARLSDAIMERISAAD